MRVTSVLIIIFTLSFALVQTNINASGEGIQRSVKSGHYVPSELVTASKLRELPIPYSNRDYALYQSIDKISNVVIGSFAAGEQIITLIQDKNADGKVDIVVHLEVDQNKIYYNQAPDKYCGVEKFKKYKEDIINGNTENISPNPEGVAYIKELIKTPRNIKKANYGFRVSKTDIDEPLKEKVSYHFSYRKISGANIYFVVNYYTKGIGRISPIINHSVYCKNSKDPFAIEIARKYIKEIGKNFYDYD